MLAGMDEKVHERFCGVETKVAYHDRDLAEMNTTLYRQQQIIDQLQADLKKVRQQLMQLGLEGDPDKDQPPPHY